jgi:hypothetical protein
VQPLQQHWSSATQRREHLWDLAHWHLCDVRQAVHGRSSSVRSSVSGTLRTTLPCPRQRLQVPPVSSERLIPSVSTRGGSEPFPLQSGQGSSVTSTVGSPGMQRNLPQVRSVLASD